MSAGGYSSMTCSGPLALVFLPLALALPCLPPLHSTVVVQPLWVKTYSTESTRYSPSRPVLKPWALMLRSANRSVRPGISGRTAAVERLKAGRPGFGRCPGWGHADSCREKSHIKHGLEEGLKGSKKS